MDSLYVNALNLEETGLVQAITSHRLDSQSDRRRFYDQIRLEPEQFVSCHQVHGNKVEVIFRSPETCPLPLAEADAIVTNQVDLVIAVFTADCIPIFILDPHTCSIGIIHAGWRGTYKFITTEAIQSMQKHFGTNPANCLIHLGISIQQSCYQVSQDLADQFERHFGPDVRTSDNKLNLQTANVQQLVNVGVPFESISISPLCTACRTDLFYSFRVEGESAGRLVSFIRLLPNSY